MFFKILRWKALWATCLVLAASLACYAQQTVWEGSSKQLNASYEQGQKKVGKLKQWKKYIAEWGLDSQYNHALALSARLHTNGWSGGLYYLNQRSAGKKTLWQLHFSEIKHEKEIKQQRTGNGAGTFGESTPYIFGKINNLYTLQLAYGREQTLFPALLNGNMSVSLRYSAGPALALLKPYYLNLIYIDYIPDMVVRVEAERYAESNSERFLQPGSILGKAGWSKGLGEIRYVPGVFAELAVTLDADRPKAFAKTVTIGGNAAFYSSSLALMAERKAYPWQVSFFVGLALGKRWK